jgi:hypothetical protein
MSKNPIWANLAIIDQNQAKGCAVETIFVTDSEVTLSGAWVFDDYKDPDLAIVLENRLVITNAVQKNLDLKKLGSVAVNLHDFIKDAEKRAIDSVEIFNRYVKTCDDEYKAYMAIPPAERRLLPKMAKRKFEPIYMNDWNFDLDLEMPGKSLDAFGKLSEIRGTPSEMKYTIQLAWLLKHLIEMWNQDESERFARKNMDPSFAEFKILPDTWLKQVVMTELNREAV